MRDTSKAGQRGIKGQYSAPVRGSFPGKDKIDACVIYA